MRPTFCGNPHPSSSASTIERTQPQKMGVVATEFGGG